MFPFIIKLLGLSSIISISAGETLTNFHTNATSFPLDDFPCPEAANIAPCVCIYDSDSGRLTLDCTDISSNEELANIFTKEFPVKDFWEFKMKNSSTLTSLDFTCGDVRFERFDLYPGPFPLVEVSDYFYLSCSSSNISYVYLRDTQLSSLVFPPPPLNDRITYFEMFYSNLTSVPVIRSNSLKTLYLEYSKISQIIPGTFDEIPELKSLGLYENSIKILEKGSIPITSNVDYFSIASNQLETIEPGAFNLTEIPTLNSLNINIYNNLLKTIDASVFEFLMPYIDILRFYGNPLDCGCDLAWIILNPDYMEKVTYGAPSCADGTLLTDLDPTPYEQFC